MDHSLEIELGCDERHRISGTHTPATLVDSSFRHPHAYAERWVRTVRADCLDHLLIVGRRHLERVLAVYVRHYNAHRPHRALGLAPPDRSAPVPAAALPLHARRHDLLGGLIHEYQAAA
jgi:putative transposase